MTSLSPVDALHGELNDASPTLVGNADLLRSVLAGCGDCIKLLDLEGRLIFMSEGGKRVMEVEDFSVLKGCPWPEFWAGEGNRQAAAAVASARDGKTARFRGAANTAKGNPRYWDVQVSPIGGDDGKPSHLLSISRDITEEWNATELLKKNAERQHFLTAELQHRVKNMLATVMAIANRTFRGEAYEAPRQVFGARLMTLSQAHDALTASNWDRAGILGIVRGALKPHQMGQDRVVMAGPDLDLDPKQALALALAINELATNASKYGALSKPTGIVDVSWSRDGSSSGPAFVFVWRELGGPPVVAPKPGGIWNASHQDIAGRRFRRNGHAGLRTDRFRMHPRRLLSKTCPVGPLRRRRQRQPERLAQKLRALEPVAPRQLDRLGDADARRRRRSPAVSSRATARTAAGRAAARCGACVMPSACAQPPGPRAQQPLVGEPAPPPHLGKALRRLERADQHGAGRAFRLADEVQAPVDAVGAVDVGVAGRAEHHGVARRSGRR